MMTIEHEAFKAAGTNTDDADDRTVLLAILGCAQSWSGEVRILGNVRASDAFRAVRNAIAQLSTADDLLKSLKAAVDIIDEHVPRDAQGVDHMGDFSVPGGVMTWAVLDEHLHYMRQAIANAECNA